MLREAYRKDFLVEKQPLMGMRHRYIHLMHKSERWKKTDVSPYKIKGMTSFLTNTNFQTDLTRRKEQRLEVAEETLVGGE